MNNNNYLDVNLADSAMKIEEILSYYDIVLLGVESCKTKHAYFHHTLAHKKGKKFPLMFDLLGIQMLLKDCQTPALSIFTPPDDDIQANDLVDYFLSNKECKMNSKNKILFLGNSKFNMSDIEREIKKNDKFIKDLITVYRLGCTYGYYNLDKENDKLRMRYKDDIK